MMAPCEHAWERIIGPGDTFFEPVPNSRRQPRRVRFCQCRFCDAIGFQYPPSRVIYTWSRDPANWEAAA
jgi:hypothetical protein